MSITSPTDATPGGTVSGDGLDWAAVDATPVDTNVVGPVDTNVVGAPTIIVPENHPNIEPIATVESESLDTLTAEVPEENADGPVPGEIITLPDMDPKSDLTTLISILIGTAEEGDARLGELLKRYKTKEDLTKALTDETLFVNTLYRVMIKSMSTPQQKLLVDFLTTMKSNTKELSNAIKGIQDLVNNGKKQLSKDGNPVELKGQEAKIATIARMRGVRKIFLPNSGFYVVIRPMTLSELVEFARTVDSDEKELGRILGGHFHIISDFYIKQKFMELVPRIVIASNLAGFNSPNVLMDNIAFHDYDVLLHAVCAIMYKSGIVINLTCPKCDVSFNGQKVDLNKIKYHVLDDLSAEAVQFMTSSKSVTPEMAKDYRHNLLPHTGFIDDGNVRYIMQVPTMSYWMECSNRLMSRLSSVIQGKPQFDDEKTTLEFTVNIARMMTPWIGEVQYMDNNKPDAVIKEPDSVMEALEASMIENATPDSDIYTKISSFIQRTKLTYICYTMVKCPKCGATPASSLDGYVPVDVQELFFNLACHQLSVTGK